MTSDPFLRIKVCVSFCEAIRLLKNVFLHILNFELVFVRLFVLRTLSRINARYAIQINCETMAWRIFATWSIRCFLIGNYDIFIKAIETPYWVPFIRKENNNYSSYFTATWRRQMQKIFQSPNSTFAEAPAVLGPPIERSFLITLSLS